MTLDPLIAYLRDARERADLTRTAVADAAGLAVSTVSKCEGGYRHTTVDTLSRWGAALGVQLAWMPVAYRPGATVVQCKCPAALCACGHSQTAPAGSELPAGHGAPRQAGVAAGDGAPASSPGGVGSDLARADVAHAHADDPWAPCSCGHVWLRHDVAEHRGDNSEMCCVEGCDQNGCPGRAVARTLDVAERTAAMNRRRGGKPRPHLR